jgi:hypothetical protein
VLPLEPDQVSRKLEALKRHKTQFSASKLYLESYMRANELFDRIEDIPLGTEGVLLLPSGAGVPAGSALPEGASPDGAERRVRLEGSELVFTVTLNPASAAEIETDLSAFGYRSDRPFGEMPKIAVATKGSSHKVTERGKTLPEDSVKVSRSPGQVEVRIPLDQLGQPEKIFFTAEARAGKTPLDVLPWVVLDLSAAQ